ncbi:chemotaxis-specific protein-glutamate methyltransferase CheB [Turneriella parva]|uniref:Protein-glutamate methylesterase/protein-glutamine glutaminase n=1 Tax=Turneriella parva (strain ATCC BAA-1111 / DSM 21527 / NCTC 11395 / H) TaxID=869212 RepID=I4BB37_TURPD|nr:chemotaxis-specific protein-glutamate methyltransferase CheB [Turneriella parva]AFM14494.1 response regulator receiver modulated CheB methylesterase [Turneriella parva DSM 21527]
MKTQVLIVDDSEVYRLFLRNALAGVTDVEVVSVASNGRLAMPRVNHYKPDIVLLDYDMPEMDGLAAIPEIKRLSPKTRIIMFSTHTTQGARLTLKALELGADDFIAKPAGALGGTVADDLRAKLLEHIRGFVVTNTTRVAPAEPKPLLKARDARAVKKFRYCLIGISTGGPPALRRLFKLLPADLKGSILVVQHMPPLFTAQLAESLNEESALTIVEATTGVRPQPATVYIAPGGKQMRLKPDAHGDAVIIVEESDPKELCKPSVNILFNSAAEFCAPETTAIIMTGMGEDGYMGMKALSAGGAYLMAQQQEDCVIFGMPAKPIRDGIIDEEHDVEGLAKKITEYLR